MPLVTSAAAPLLPNLSCSLVSSGNTSQPLLISDSAKRGSVSQGQASKDKQQFDAADRLVREEVTRYASLLRECGNAKALTEGKRVHAHAFENGYDHNTFVANLLVQMYGKCGDIREACSVFDQIQEKNVFSWNIMMAAYIQNGCLEEAEKIFDRIPSRSVVSWNAMITAYAQYGHLQKARNLFDKMPQKDVSSWNAIIAVYFQGKEVMKLFQMMNQEGVLPNHITFVCILNACSSLQDLRIIHARVVTTGLDSDVEVGNAIINVYGKCGCLDDARKAFDTMSQRDVVSWTSMITAYTQNGHVQDARSMFDGMPQRSIASWNTMISAYAQAGDIEESIILFEKMPQRDVISWNGMIVAYTQNGHSREALRLFSMMDLHGVRFDKVTLIAAIDACASLSVEAEGQIMHATAVDAGFQFDVMVGTALLNMFGKCKNVVAARSIFDELPRKNLVTWNAMIAVYAQNLLEKKALEIFRLMDLEGIQADRVTFLTILDACSFIADFRQGQIIHANLIATGICIDVALGTAIVNMYGKCGHLEDARCIFDKLVERNVVTWSAMLAVYAQNGFGTEAVELYQLMAQEGLEANGVTFLGILFACTHAGLFDDGVEYFISMRQDYGITPDFGHYLNMIDLLSRSGQLQVAEELANNMPYEPGSVAWMTLLGACRLHGDVTQAARIGQYVYELEPEEPAPYVLLSNIYATVRDLPTRRGKQLMRLKGVKNQ